MCKTDFKYNLICTIESAQIQQEAYGLYPSPDNNVQLWSK